MSLDVYLRQKGAAVMQASSGIFVRENGETKEISEQEWNEKHPDRESMRMQPQKEESDEVYSSNITHNLCKMADEAGLYEALWQPHRLKDLYNIQEDDYAAESKFESENPSIANDIRGKLVLGLHILKADPERFKRFNPENGWGNYEGLVRFVENYLKACEEYPDAEIGISR